MKKQSTKHKTCLMGVAICVEKMIDVNVAVKVLRVFFLCVFPHEFFFKNMFYNKNNNFLKWHILPQC